MVILLKVVLIMVIMVIWWCDPYRDVGVKLTPEGDCKKLQELMVMHKSVMMFNIFNVDWLTPRKKNNKKKKNRKKNKAKQNGQIRADTEVVSATLEL